MTGFPSPGPAAAVPGRPALLSSAPRRTGSTRFAARPRRIAMSVRSLPVSLVVALGWAAGTAPAEEPTARVGPFHGYTRAVELTLGTTRASSRTAPTWDCRASKP